MTKVGFFPAIVIYIISQFGLHKVSNLIVIHEHKFNFNLRKLCMFGEIISCNLPIHVASNLYPLSLDLICLQNIMLYMAHYKIFSSHQFNSETFVKVIKYNIRI